MRSIKFIPAMVLSVSLLTLAGNACAGISVGGTRLIYPGDQKEVPLNVKSSADSGVYLIRSWAENNDKANKSQPPFVITPPLFRIDPGQENVLRLSQTNTSGLPKDRETLYWLNVMAIPPAADKSKSGLQFSLNTKIKLIYRPASLNDKGSVNEAYKKLGFSHKGNGVEIKNPTPYYISVFKLRINGVDVKDKNITVPPLGTTSVATSVAGNNITWSAINDNGGITGEASATF